MIRRIAELEAEIARCSADLTRLEAALEAADNDAAARPLVVAVCQEADNLRALRQLLFETEDIATMRERAGDRSYGRWVAK